jgi:hypothetical protein
MFNTQVFPCSTFASTLPHSAALGDISANATRMTALLRALFNQRNRLRR